MSATNFRSFGRIAIGVAAGSLVAACVPATSRTVQIRVPFSVAPGLGEGYPIEAEFELLGAARGRACVARGPDVMRPAPPFDAAIYNAINSVPGADNLVYVRGAAESTDEQVCAMVAGRAYRLRSMRAAGLARAPARDGDAASPSETQPAAP